MCKLIQIRESFLSEEKGTIMSKEEYELLVHLITELVKEEREIKGGEVEVENGKR